MFGGKTKRDLDEVIINLSRAYDFIQAYAESQESNKNSVGYEAARQLQNYISCCLLGLKSIDLMSDMDQYLEKFRLSFYDRPPNKYTAVFANPDITYDKEISSMLMQIEVASSPWRDFKSHQKAKELIDQYCKKVNPK